MKRNLLAALVILCLAGCKNDDIFATVKDVSYPQDSLVLGEDIKMYIPEVIPTSLSNTVVTGEEGSSAATIFFSLSALVDGDESATLCDDTKITIKDLDVCVSGEPLPHIYHPTISPSIAEPDTFAGWHSLPFGVSHQKCPLFSVDESDIVKVPAGKTPIISIRFDYIVRTWSHLFANGLSEVHNNYSVVVPFDSPVIAGDIYHLPLRIAVSSVKPDTTAAFSL